MSRARFELSQLGPVAPDGTASTRRPAPPGRDEAVATPPPARPASLRSRGERATPRRTGVNKKNFMCFVCFFKTRSVKEARKHFVFGHVAVMRAAPRRKRAPAKHAHYMDLLHRTLLESTQLGWFD
jgi:hypothetical protein